MNRLHAAGAILVAMCAVQWLSPGVVSTRGNGTASGPGGSDARQSERLLRQALRIRAMGPAVEADTLARRALERDSMDIDASVALSRARLFFGKYSDVISIENRFLRDHPIESLAWGLLGDAYFGVGQYRSVDSCYYVMYGINPDFNSLVRVAREYFEFKPFDQVVEYIDKAVRAGEDESVNRDDLDAAYVQQASAYLEYGFWDAALKAVAHVDSGYVDGTALRARILELQGDLKGAIRLYERAAGRRCATADLPDPVFQSLLARAYLKAGRKAAADSLVNLADQQYQSLAADFPDAVTPGYAEFLLEWGRDLKKAQALAYRLTRTRRDARTYELLAWAYYKNGNFENAWSSIALALRSKALYPRLFWRAAVIAKAAGHKDKFQTLADRCRRANPQVEAMYGRL